MKAINVYVWVTGITLLAILFQSFSHHSQNEPWSEKQLMEPVALAAMMYKGESASVYIYNIGPSGLIKNAVDIGQGRDPNNLEKLKTELKTLPKDALIVLYCGCCPFKDCPNIRPPFALLNDMNFKNHRLLNLKQNLKVDWIDKGYPMGE
jgi:hypothetical protein